MLLSLPKNRVVTPLTFATTGVKGGLVYTRPPFTPVVVPARAEYKRRLLDRPPRVGPTRVTYSTRRTLRLGRPPGVVTPVRGWRQFFKRSGIAPPVVATKVWHRRHRGFTKWARAVRVGYTPQWVSRYRPRRQPDPLLGIHQWHYRGGSSWLRFTTQVDRASTVAHRFHRLRYRRRSHRQQLSQLTRLYQYRRLHWGRRRRRLPPAQKRYHYFRRRRLRPYLLTGVVPASPLAGTTRARYHRANLNRFARLERVDLLGGEDSYLTQMAEWTTHTFETRVARPIEYNYNRPFRGYHKLEKKRRPGARRWKLGQHPSLARPFQEVAYLRDTWWQTTALGERLTTPTEVDPLVPPLVSGFFASVYWSFHRWGRSRWRTRPTRRATRVFVQAVKSGTAREWDAVGWGTASSAPTGVLQSLQLENEVYQTPAPPVFLPLLPRPPRWPWWRLQATRVVARLVALAWRWGFTPLWWPYARVAQLLCWSVWRVCQVGAFGVALLKAGATGVGHLVFRQFVRPIHQYVTHWVKERQVVKTASWVWTSWLLVYTNDNQQAELEVNQIEDDGYNLILEEEFDVANEHDQDYDQLGEGAHIHQPQVLPLTAQWQKDWDSFWDDLLEVGEDFFFSEVPHRVGLLVRPWVDLLLRLPLWGVAEGVSLVVLVVKLEYHRRWHSLLIRGDTPGRVVGRWWKLPLVGVVCLLRWLPPVVVFWGISTQLDYSTLRVTVCYTWGLPWREEYFVSWLLFSAVSAVALVGPVGWKAFLFQELGLANLLGIYTAAVEITSPEDYYPARPATLGERLHQATHTTPSKTGLEVDWWVVDRPTALAGVPGFSSYDEIRLVVARHYGYDSEPYDREMDLEALWFVFPLHLNVQPNPPHFHRDPFTMAPFHRAYRDTHGVRINQYELPFAFDTPFLWDIAPPRDWGQNYPDERRLYLEQDGVATLSDHLDES